MLTIRANPAHLQAAALEQRKGTTQETAQETQEKILALLRDEPSLTRPELASRLGIGTDSVRAYATLAEAPRAGAREPARIRRPRDEMVHLLERTHGSRFVALMDRFMPTWRDTRVLLNRLPAGHQRWKWSIGR